MTEAGGNTAIGAAVRAARAAQGRSLRELAQLIDVSAGTLSAIENGRTRLSVARLHDIAHALDVPVRDLITGPEPPGRVAGVPVTGPAGDWRNYPPMPLDPVLRAAVGAFVDLGYHGASMRTIAARAGMSVPGVYHHYPGKQHILAAILDLSMAEALWRVAAARDEGTGSRERLALIVQSLALFHTHRREVAFIGSSEMRSLEPAGRGRIAAQRTAVQRILDAEIDHGIAEGVLSTPHPHDAGRAISAMCTALAQWFRPSGPVTPERIAVRYAHFALRLLGCPEGDEHPGEPEHPRPQ